MFTGNSKEFASELINIVITIFYKQNVNNNIECILFLCSVKMVIMWLSGDIFKTAYFVLRKAPVQFWLCGILQVGLDISILSQVIYYKMYPHGAFKSAIQ